MKELLCHYSDLLPRYNGINSLVIATYNAVITSQQVMSVSTFCLVINKGEKLCHTVNRHATTLVRFSDARRDVI